VKPWRRRTIERVVLYQMMWIIYYIHCTHVPCRQDS
jgi:hypothetical protein